MFTAVRGYSTQQLLDRIKKLPSFNGFPIEDFLVGVRSNENGKNKMDDKFYHFLTDNDGQIRCANVLYGTTQSGAWGFLNYFKWNKKGVAEIKDNECYYDVWKSGLHRGKMKALRQVGGFKVIRKKDHFDTNKEWTWEFNRGLNFHTITYKLHVRVVRWFINKWSTGCQVVNDNNDYYKSLPKLSDQNKVSYFLLKEFTPGDNIN